MLSAVIFASASASGESSGASELSWVAVSPICTAFGLRLKTCRPLAPRRPVALVNYDVAEVIRWIVVGKEVGRALLVVNIQRLIRRNQHASVLLRISPCDNSGIIAERVLKSGRSLGAKLVAVADKQCTPYLPCISDSTEQVDCDERFSQRLLPVTTMPVWVRKCARNGRFSLERLESLHPDSSGGLLLRPHTAPTEASLHLSTRPKRMCCSSAHPKAFWGRELLEGTRCGGYASKAVVFHEEVPIAGEGKRHVEPFAGCVLLCLF